MAKLILLIGLSLTWAFGKATGQECPVVPLPQHARPQNTLFELTPQTRIVLKDSGFIAETTFFKNEVLRYTSIPLSGQKGSSTVILIQKAPLADKKDGGYSLKMNNHLIQLSAATREGIFNGLMTLLQLVRIAPNDHHSIKVACWDIQDAPLYTWRGFMLDESRHFFGKQTVEQLLEQMALLKLNRFHWHLTDAQGWRMAIKHYPKLSLVGGIGNAGDSAAPAQYYTQAEIREIVAYARTRHIKIIPEIDMPGHATAANKAYPQYSGGGTGKYANFTFNPGNENTYRYLSNILKETAVLFPAGIIHLGGDEVSFGSKSWNKDPGVKALMQKKQIHNLKGVEHYFFKRMTDSALHLFHTVAAWDEATDAQIPKDSTLIFWWRHDKPQQLRKALSKGYKVIMCPRIPLYFDFVQDSTHISGRRWAGKFSTVKQVYEFSTHTYPVADDYPQQIAGIQANLWTETVRSVQRLQFLTFPRIAALAEAAWTSPDNRNYQAFLGRLKNQFNFYKEENISYFNPVAPQKTPEIIH